MARSNRRRDDAVPLDLQRIHHGVPRTERYAGGDWAVRTVSGAQGGRSYRCPGCQQELTGIPHVVVWPTDGLGGVEDRRHWHTGCWGKRDERPPRGSYR